MAILFRTVHVRKIESRDSQGTFFKLQKQARRNKRRFLIATSWKWKNEKNCFLSFHFSMRDRDCAQSNWSGWIFFLDKTTWDGSLYALLSLIIDVYNLMVQVNIFSLRTVLKCCTPSVYITLRVIFAYSMLHKTYTAVFFHYIYI